MPEQIPLPLAIIIAATVLSIAIVVAALIVARGVKSQQARGADPLTQNQAAPFFPMPLPPLSPEALPVEPSGISVDADTRLEVGMRVLADWNGIWWRARVIGLESGGRVRVHYLGWEDRWDETVPRSRLQVDLTDSLRNG